VVIRWDQLVPSFAGRAGGGGPRSSPPSNDKKEEQQQQQQYQLDPSQMREMGFMLSLRLADGRPNPKETFGEQGSIFPFSLVVQSIEPLFEES